jgi:hypothetical protein
MRCINLGCKRWNIDGVCYSLRPSRCKKRISDSEHGADSPGGVSGRIAGSPAERSVAGNQCSTAGQSRVPRRSAAEPGNSEVILRESASVRINGGSP